MLETLRELRIASGAQLARLHVEGTLVTQSRKARASLQRLVVLGVVVRLERRIGGVRSGSQGFCYVLSGLGYAVLDLDHQPARRHRRAVETKPAFHNHRLTITETYTQIVEHCRIDQTQLRDFAGEPRCYRRFPGPLGQAVILKPDAYLRLRTAEYEASAFLEVDLDTESLPTIARKLAVYSGYWRSGIEQRRWGVFPLVWWFTPTVARCEAIAHTIQRLPADTHHLFAVGLLADAAHLLTQHPTQGGAR